MKLSAHQTHSLPDFFTTSPIRAAMDYMVPPNPCAQRGRPSDQGLVHPKKVGCLPAQGDTQEL